MYANCTSGVLAFACCVCSLPNVRIRRRRVEQGIEAILPQMEEFIPMLVAFIILWVVLAKFGWPLFEGMLEEAREYNQELTWKKPEEARQESERLLAEYQEQLEGAKVFRLSKHAQQRTVKSGEALEKEITERARAEADAIDCRRLKVAIEAEKRAALKDLQNSMARYVYRSRHCYACDR